MFIFDRIYGQLKFPPIVQEVLDCPGLLRLREVRMANIPFFSFPSFSTVTRYEHSLGVCHLAGLLAETVGLNKKDKTELMLAALYHDVATPPFAHAVEEVLYELFGFDHEKKLWELIVGHSDNIGGQKAQLFLGRSLKLHRICQSKEGRKLKLDVIRIANIATGRSSDPLCNLICSKDIDLDNIDNVVRAGSAMGIKGFDLNLPEALARSFVFNKGRFYIDEGSLRYLRQWQKVRAILYGMIFASKKDFALQTMLKAAVNLLPSSELEETDWSLTDDQLIYEKLLKYQPSADIVNRMRLGDTFNSLLCLIFEDNDSLDNLHSISIETKKLAEKIYIDFLKRTLKPKDATRFKPNIIVNYYLDKRIRQIRRTLVFLNRVTQLNESKSAPKIIFGIFTSNNRTWDKKAIDRMFYNFSKLNLKSEIKLLNVKHGEYPDIVGQNYTDHGFEY